MGDLIQHKRSSTPGAVPDATDLSAGELALNTADGKLYMKKADGAVLVMTGDPWICQPIGVPFPLWTHLTGVTAPPTDSPSYRYVKLTASDSYNTGVLTGESVTGSAPLVQATAVISDAASPLNGQTVRLINTERRVLRAGSSGTVEADGFQGHAFGDPDQVGTYPYMAQINQRTGGSATPTVSTLATTSDSSDVSHAGGFARVGPVSDGANGTPRVNNETRPKNIGADYYMRIR